MIKKLAAGNHWKNREPQRYFQNSV